MRLCSLSFDENGKRKRTGYGGELHQITRMLPAPLTSFAPAYMALKRTWPGSEVQRILGQEVCGVPVVGPRRQHLKVSRHAPKPRNV